MILSVAAWGVFWMVMGRHMHDFDFSATYPGHNVEWSYFEPANGFILFARWAALAIIFSAMPGIIAGAGMLKFKPWARKLGIMVSVVNIVLLFPLHLFVGIYGLVMLTKGGALFRDQ